MASASSSDVSQADAGITETLHVCLTLIKDGTTGDSFNSTVETLYRIFSNAFNYPKEEKYRSLKKSNKTFQEKVWQYDGAQQFMLAVGSIEVDECVILPSDAELSTAVQVLQHYHRLVTPASTNHSSVTTVTPEEAKKKQNLEKEKQKHQEEMRRMRAERKRISEQIKADRKEIGTRETRAAKARDITKGANIKRFEDIGVDLNKGGG